MKRFDYRALLKRSVTVITAHAGREGTRVNSPDHIRAAIASGAEVWRSLWQCDDVETAIEAIARDGSPLMNIDHTMITPEYDVSLRAIGSGFSAWTVDDEADIRRFLEMGIGNITTRRPSLAMRLRQEIQGTRCSG